MYLPLHVNKANILIKSNFPLQIEYTYPQGLKAPFIKAPAGLPLLFSSTLSHSQAAGGCFHFPQPLPETFQCLFSVSNNSYHLFFIVFVSLVFQPHSLRVFIDLFIPCNSQTAVGMGLEARRLGRSLRERRGEARSS